MCCLPWSFLWSSFGPGSCLSCTEESWSGHITGGFSPQRSRGLFYVWFAQTILFRNTLILPPYTPPNSSNSSKHIMLNHNSAGCFFLMYHKTEVRRNIQSLGPLTCISSMKLLLNLTWKKWCVHWSTLIHVHEPHSAFFSEAWAVLSLSAFPHWRGAPVSASSSWPFIGLSPLCPYLLY